MTSATLAWRDREGELSVLLEQTEAQHLQRGQCFHHLQVSSDQAESTVYLGHSSHVDLCIEFIVMKVDVTGHLDQTVTSSFSVFSCQN